MIWVTSDWHFNHDKPFIYQPRGFNNVEEMNEGLINLFNEKVAKDDDVYVLGDLCMGKDLESNKKLIESLNGRLHIIIGNHDTANRLKMYLECDNIVEIAGYATMLKTQGYTFYLSHYPTITSNYDDKPNLKDVTINLCGHTHTSLKFLEADQYNHISYHVEVDAHNCYPVSINQIIEELQLAHCFKNHIFKNPLVK